MFDIGISELIILAALGLLVLGPERLPAVAKKLGLWMHRARVAFDRFRHELDREITLDNAKERADELVELTKTKTNESEQPDQLESKSDND